MQHHAADHLHVEMAQAQGPHAGLTNAGECFRQQFFQGFARLKALPEFRGLALQFFVGESLYRRFEVIDLTNRAAQFGDHPLITAAEYLGNQGIDHGSERFLAWMRPRALIVTKWGRNPVHASKNADPIVIFHPLRCAPPVLARMACAGGIPVCWGNGKPRVLKVSKPRQVGDLIKAGKSGFAGTLARAKKLQSLEARLHNCLQPDLANRVRVANLKQESLILVTPSAAIAARLRLEAPELARAMRAAGAVGISEIEVRVAPLPDQGARPVGRRPLSTAARRALQGVTEQNEE